MKTLLALVISSGLSFSAHAAEPAWPAKPIRLLLGFPAGGGSDIVARLVAKPLGERLGQSVVVDNKPGAGGNIAAEMLTRATPRWLHTHPVTQWACERGCDEKEFAV